MDEVEQVSSVLSGQSVHVGTCPSYSDSNSFVVFRSTAIQPWPTTTSRVQNHSPTARSRLNPGHLSVMCRFSMHDIRAGAPVAVTCPLCAATPGCWFGCCGLAVAVVVVVVVHRRSSCIIRLSSVHTHTLSRSYLRYSQHRVRMVRRRRAY